MAMRLFASTLVIGWLGMTSAFAKAPEAPTVPQTEFKVLPSHSQEFFQTDEAPLVSAFVPVTEVANPMSILGAVGGAGLNVAWNYRQTRGSIVLVSAEARPYRNRSGGLYSFRSNGMATEPYGSRLTIDFQKWGLAREVFEMAEAFRHERNWGEAERWFAGVCHLWPRSPYAALANQRKEAIVLQRLLNEAGEEQSEEPPLASPERLKVMPRELR